MTYLTVEQIKVRIEKQIEEKIIEMSKHSITIENSRKALSDFSVLLNDIKNLTVNSDEVSRLHKDSKKAVLADEVAMLSNTLKLDLVLIETDYAITNEKLLSPSGTHPSERIFVQTDICIHTNNRKTVAPEYNGNLYLNNLKKIA